MSPVLSQYLESIRSNLRLEPSVRREIVTELETHIEERIEELEAAGLSEEEAARACLGLMGSARLIARQIYEASSQGTWKQVLLASTPNLLFGLAFALNWWQHATWLSVLLLLVLGAAVWGWWRRRPVWVFPWLGCSLVPLLMVGIILMYVPRGWSLVMVLVYFPLALWWLLYIVLRAVRRDWLLGSLVLLPLPIFLGWLLAVSPGLRLGYSIERVYYFAPWIGLSFMAFALTIAAFIRIRQRYLRIALLLTSAVATLTMTAYYTEGGLGTNTFVGLILVMWGVFLVPPLVERWLRKRQSTWGDRDKWQDDAESSRCH